MIVWIGFIVLIGLFLALDLGVFNRTPHEITTKEAFRWTLVWVSVSLLFSGFVYFGYENQWLGLGVDIGQALSGKEAVIKYLTGYLIEQSLSIDNIFVIALIFTYFRIPQKYQHRTLFWGIVGALIFRGLMIGAGAYLMNEFSWMTYVFGLILLYSAYRMWRSSNGEEAVDPEKNPVVRFFQRFFPVTSKMDGEQFFIVEAGKRVATPLFIALLVIETSDVMFAFDSIPAIFAITTDPFLVFTSNIFAILGLRSLYFVLASVLDRFKFLEYALILILAFVGVKMLLAHQVHMPEWVSLIVVAVVLTGGILLSLFFEEDELPIG